MDVISAWNKDRKDLSGIAEQVTVTLTWGINADGSPVPKKKSIYLFYLIGSFGDQN